MTGIISPMPIELMVKVMKMKISALRLLMPVVTHEIPKIEITFNANLLSIPV